MVIFNPAKGGFEPAATLMGVVLNIFAERMRINVCVIVVEKIILTKRSEVGILNLL